MKILIIANIISLAGCILMVLIGLVKKKKSVLIMQSIQCVLLGISNLLLKGYSGAVSDVVTIARNVYCYKFKYGKVAKIVFVALNIIVAVIFNNRGLVGYAPCVASIIFTLSLGSENIIHIKIAGILAQGTWAAFDFSIQNYTGFVFDCATVVSNVVGIIRVTIDKRRANG